MSCKLSDLVENPGVHNKECEKCMKEKKNMQECKFIGFKDDRLRYKCKECGNKYSKLPNEAIENFPILYQFCNSELNIFFLLLGKGIYPSEYMDSWGKFNEVLVTPKEAFYRELNENISDADYEHVQKVWEVFEIKNLGEYHDLYAQRDTVLFADVFEKFRDKCAEIYGLDPAHFVSAQGLAWQAWLKITKVELELLTDINMLLMVENWIRSGICQATHRYAEANNKYLEDYDKNIESSYIPYLDANNLYGWAMSQKVPENGFKWVEEKNIKT